MRSFDNPCLQCLAHDRAGTGERQAQELETIYWHRDLPPLDAEFVAEHTVEATSMRVPMRLAYRDQLWSRCYDDLMTRASERLQQEVARLGGRYAHVMDESIDSRHDDATGENYLHGRFTYNLFR
jgi:hypothetical protein